MTIHELKVLEKNKKLVKYIRACYKLGLFNALEDDEAFAQKGYTLISVASFKLKFDLYEDEDNYYLVKELVENKEVYSYSVQSMPKISEEELQLAYDAQFNRSIHGFDILMIISLVAIGLSTAWTLYSFFSSFDVSNVLPALLNLFASIVSNTVFPMIAYVICRALSKRYRG